MISSVKDVFDFKKRKISSKVSRDIPDLKSPLLPFRRTNNKESSLPNKCIAFNYLPIDSTTLCLIAYTISGHLTLIMAYGVNLLVF